MSYEPTEWKTGDVVTSQKLNKLENGVAGAGGAVVEPVFTLTEDEQAESGYSVTCNMSAAEIIEAVGAGTCRTCKYIYNGDYYFMRVNFYNLSDVFFEDTFIEIDEVINARIMVNVDEPNPYYIEFKYPQQ